MADVRLLWNENHINSCIICGARFEQNCKRHFEINSTHKLISTYVPSTDNLSWSMQWSQIWLVIVYLFFIAAAKEYRLISSLPALRNNGAVPLGSTNGVALPRALYRPYSYGLRRNNAQFKRIECTMARLLHFRLTVQQPATIHLADTRQPKFFPSIFVWSIIPSSFKSLNGLYRTGAF